MHRGSDLDVLQFPPGGAGVSENFNNSFAVTPKSPHKYVSELRSLAATWMRNEKINKKLSARGQVHTLNGAASRTAHPRSHESLNFGVSQRRIWGAEFGGFFGSENPLPHRIPQLASLLRRFIESAAPQRGAGFGGRAWKVEKKQNSATPRGAVGVPRTAGLLPLDSFRLPVDTKSSGAIWGRASVRLNFDNFSFKIV